MALNETAVPLQKIFIISNHKGGVGKTTTAVNLADAISREGPSVLLLDLDPQGNLTEHAAVDSTTPFADLALMRPIEYKEHIASAIGNSIVEGVKLVRPCKHSLDLDELKTKLEARRIPNIENHLARLIKEFSKGFDITIVDTPPSLGLLTTSATLAATHIIIPVETDGIYSAYGYEHLLKLISDVKEDEAGNPDLDYLGILINKYRSNVNSSKDFRNFLVKNGKVLDTTIRRSKDVAESQIRKQSVLTYSRSSRVSLDYVDLAREVLKKMNVTIKKKTKKAA